MRIILASEYFYPVSKGGTEMYVYQLAKELIKNGHECLIISLSNEITDLVYDGINIKYIPFDKNSYEESEFPKNLNQLLEIVKDFETDIFHLHTYTSSLGLTHLIKIKEIGIKTVFTSHLPNLTCLRGDLMRFGQVVCSGELLHNRCMDCYLHSTGIKNEITRELLIKLSYNKFFRKLIARLNQVNIKQSSIDLFKRNDIEIVVVSQWQKRVLENNGFKSHTLKVTRQAIEKKNILENNKSTTHNNIQIGFIGRIVKVKGLHILLEALNDVDDAKYQLNVVAVKSLDEFSYYEEMKQIASLKKVNWYEDLETEEIFEFLDKIDLLVIPSIWLETGPIVAFEALARKIPILAFNYGGVVEITNNLESFLVETKEEMAETLNEIINDKSKLFRKAQNINFNRTTEMLYNETINHYNKLLFKND